MSKNPISKIATITTVVGLAVTRAITGVAEVVIPENLGALSQGVKNLNEIIDSGIKERTKREDED